MNGSAMSPIQVVRSVRRSDYSPETFAQFGAGYLPGHLGERTLAIFRCTQMVLRKDR